VLDWTDAQVNLEQTRETNDFGMGLKSSFLTRFDVKGADGDA
jgi:hypothetical protein